MVLTLVWSGGRVTYSRFMPEYLTYASSGVDVEAGDKAVELLRASVQRTQVRETIGDLGGFAGMYDATALSRMSRPVLATSTDGIGTKVAIAQALGIHDTLGFDLVGMVVDDLVVCGARPMFMTDYIACGRVVPERIASIVEGVSSACVEAGVALLGGETAPPASGTHGVRRRGCGDRRRGASSDPRPRACSGWRRRDRPSLRWAPLERLCTGAAGH